jgi:hypothetical protein
MNNSSRIRINLLFICAYFLVFFKIVATQSVNARKNVQEFLDLSNFCNLTVLLYTRLAGSLGDGSNKAEFTVECPGPQAWAIIFNDTSGVYIRQVVPSGETINFLADSTNYNLEFHPAIGSSLRDKEY